MKFFKRKLRTISTKFGKGRTNSNKSRSIENRTRTKFLNLEEIPKKGMSSMLSNLALILVLKLLSMTTLHKYSKMK